MTPDTSIGSADLSVNGWNGEYVDALYRQWRDDPGSVDERWRRFFEGFDLGSRRVDEDGRLREADDAASIEVAHTKQGRVDSLIYHYRDIGHFAADLDPLGTERPFPEMLTLESFELRDADLEESFDPGHLPLANPAPLAEIVELLEDTYCGHVGAEYMHIQDRQQRRWLQKRMEPVRNRPALSPEHKLRVLRELIDADALETFLAKRYTGKKRFGLEGGESLIPLLNEIIDLGPAASVEEYTIGMAHRGRLNVLVNILNKTYDQLFTEFEEAWVEDFLEGGGDVKYHRGFSSTVETASGQPLRLTLSPNPSHLEFGHSVVLGRARAKQRLRGDAARERCVPLLIHGDASFPGQGIVAEMLNFSRLQGYTVGGAIHVIVNNQIGFTTDPSDLFSGRYCTDIAKMIDAPIFHVNGSDPEACVFVARLALEYRQTFKNDVVVDMWCYRKHGHNETDEPRFTQPVMYQAVKRQKPVCTLYAKRLAAEQVITQEQFDELYDERHRQMDEAQERSREQPVASDVQAFGHVWSGLSGEYSDADVDTTATRDQLLAVTEALGGVPEGFTPHKTVRKLLDYRGRAVAEGEPLDWAMGEMLAYGTLLLDGHAVRLTGQDSERGTFSHRHALVFDQETGASHDALNHIAGSAARFCIHNSPLTESACVGFEYGYSLGDPNMLVIWEAQFGDFANGAQVIFDQFVASAEIKWKRYSGFTCFLPHGYEGQGPEHSSARLERFLTLCAAKNMQVVHPTTPAQMFHLLRRQMRRNFRKPLIVMTPKSLLRHARAVSDVDDLVHGAFQRVLDDPAVTDHHAIRRIILCSGKVYYDLVEHREKAKVDDVAIIRVEELYPFPQKVLSGVLGRYGAVKEILWVQEEPKNMGAYRYIEPRLSELLDLEVHYVGREANASPAVASTRMHAQEQHTIVTEAIGLATGDGDSDGDGDGDGDASAGTSTKKSKSRKSGSRTKQTRRAPAKKSAAAR